MYHTLSASEKISVDLNMLAHIKRLAASRAAVNSRSDIKPQRNGRKALRDAGTLSPFCLCSGAPRSSSCGFAR